MNKLRPYTAITMMVVLLLMIATGLILYFAPQGPNSKFWEFSSLSKHQIKDIHFCLALVMVCLAILHGILNLNSLIKYLKQPVKLWLHPLLFSVALVFIVFVVALQL